MEAISEFFLGSLTQSGVHLGRTVRKSSRTFSRTVYFIRKKHIIINTLLTFVSLKKVIHLLETIASSRAKFMIIDSVYFAHQWYVFPEMLSGALLYKARWVGGLLSNFKLVWRELFLDTLRDPKFKHFTPMITSITKTMYRLPRAVFVSNRQYGLYAMKEASSLLIPVISLLNSNTKSNWAMYWLPANDRSPYSLKLFFELFDYIMCVLKLRRLITVKNKLCRDRVKEMLWLKDFKPNLELVTSKNLGSVSAFNKVPILGRNLRKKSFFKFKLKRLTNLVVKYLKIKARSLKRFNKTKIKFKVSKNKLLKNKGSKFAQYQNSVDKYSAKEIKNSKKNKQIKFRVKLNKFARRRLRWLKSYRRKKLRRDRRFRILKRRRFLRRKKNKRFKFNKTVSRKKLLRRFSSRIHRNVFKKRTSLNLTRRVVKKANKRLFNKFLVNVVQTDNSIENFLTKIRLFELKKYMLKSNSYLKMTQEEKMAYLDKLNISPSERARFLKK